MGTKEGAGFGQAEKEEEAWNEKGGSGRNVYGTYERRLRGQQASKESEWRGSPINNLGEEGRVHIK